MVIFDNKTKTNHYEEKNYLIRTFSDNIWY